MQDSAFMIVGNRIVLSAAIVEKDERSGIPAHSDLELGRLRVLEEEPQKHVAL